MKKICVLLSTYNGEKYIKQQIESVLEQQGVDVHCIIRDDGSIDKTVEIIEDLESKHNNLQLIKGNNIGVCQSFSWLIKYAPDVYDYYAFCDQDDIWKKDKLYIAAEKLDRDSVNLQLPQMYCSDVAVFYNEYDFDKSIHFWTVSPESITDETLLIHNWVLGCTEVFNKQAKKMYEETVTNKTEMHDYWMHLICRFFGRVIYDTRQTMYYRQHGSNVVGTRKKTFRHLFKYLSEFYKCDYTMHPRQDDAKNLLGIKMSMDSSTVDKISKIAYYNKSFTNKVRFFCNRKFHMLSLASDIAYRIRIIREIL